MIVVLVRLCETILYTVTVCLFDLLPELPYLPVYNAHFFPAHVTENVKVVFALRKLRFSSNSLQIDLSSLTHSVP